MSESARRTGMRGLLRGRGIPEKQSQQQFDPIPWLERLLVVNDQSSFTPEQKEIINLYLHKARRKLEVAALLAPHPDIIPP